LPTWSPSSPFLGAKEFDPGKHIQLVLVAASLALAGAVDTLTGIGLLPLPGLSLLADQGAGDGCSHGRHRPGTTGGSGTRGLLAGRGRRSQHAARPVPNAGDGAGRLGQRHPPPIGSGAQEAPAGRSHHSPGWGCNSLAQAFLSAEIFPFWFSDAFLFLPTSVRGKFAGRGERFCGEGAAHWADIPLQLTGQTSLRAPPDAPFARRHGTSTWRKIFASLPAPIPPPNFSPHPSPPRPNPSKHLLRFQQGLPCCGGWWGGGFWILFPLLPEEKLRSER